MDLIKVPFRLMRNVDCHIVDSHSHRSADKSNAQLVSSLESLLSSYRCKGSQLLP